MCFETEALRRDVDSYKDAPTAASKRRMENAFAALDSRIKALEAQAQTETGPDREATDRRIADLKHRRDLHWTRAQTLLAATTIRRAEPVGEQRRGKASADATSSSARRASRSRGASARRMMPEQPVRGNFFQRLFHY